MYFWWEAIVMVLYAHLLFEDPEWKFILKMLNFEMLII